VNYSEAASNYILEIIYPEDPSPVEDANIKINPCSACVRRNI
jgi:hypothetical protein